MGIPSAASVLTQLLQRYHDYFKILAKTRSANYQEQNWKRMDKIQAHRYLNVARRCDQIWSRLRDLKSLRKEIEELKARDAKLVRKQGASSASSPSRGQSKKKAGTFSEHSDQPVSTQRPTWVEGVAVLSSKEHLVAFGLASKCYSLALSFLKKARLNEGFVAPLVWDWLKELMLELQELADPSIAQELCLDAAVVVAVVVDAAERHKPPDYA